MAQLVKNPPAMRETWVRSLDGEDPLEKGKATTPYHSSMLAWVHGLYVVEQGFTDGSVVKNRLPMQETWVRSLGWEDPLEKRKATHSSILAWRIPWTV